MPIDVLTERVRSLTEEYQVTCDRDMILGTEADREAVALWQEVRAIDPGTAPRWLGDRLDEANAALGWLHYLRYRESAEPRRLAELARALLCLEPLSGDFHLIPEELRPVIGRFTDSGAQADLATSLMRALAAGTDQALLDAGIFLMTQASAAIPEHDSRQVARLSYLCLAHRLRYERNGDAASIDGAIAAGQGATAIMARHRMRAVKPLSNLAFAYWARHRLHGDLVDLKRVTGLFEQVLEVTGPGPAVLSDLATACRQYYEQTGEVTYIERAVALAEQAANLDGEVTPAILASLSAAMLRRYERTGAGQDLHRAAELVERVLAAMPEDSPQRGMYLTDAAAILLRRYERGRDPVDLDRAVDLAEQALSALPEEDPRRPDRLISFSAALYQRYLGTGTDIDLNRAATLIDWALSAIPADDARWPPASIELAAIYSSRYARTGVLAVLNRAINHGEQAVAGLVTCPPDWLTTLSGCYQQRFSATGAVADLGRAIELGERSLAAASCNDFALAGRQVRLAAAYRLRHEHEGDRAGLERAIALGQQAVTATPDDHAGRPDRMSSLAGALLARYRLDQMPADLTDAIGLGEEALARVSAEHPNRASLTTSLCNTYLERVTAGGAPPDPGCLDELARAVAGSRTAAPADRVPAHHAIGALAQASGRPRLAVAMLDTAIALLPSVAPREAGWADQQHQLGANSGLVETAVAAHCAIGDPAGAVEIAELGRGVLLASQANTRADLAELSSRNPPLGRKFRWVCERLNTPDFPAEERKRWWADYDTLLAAIRDEPGLGGFLAAPQLATLRPAAAGGCVVVINASSSRSDALAVRADADPLMIKLPGLRLADVEANVAALLEAFDDNGEPPSLAMGRHRRQVVSGVLSWLWDTAVAPVIATLDSGSAALPRVWWLPTGLLGLLPLHAAGHVGQPGALDAVVSSFVPSLRVLREARDRPPVQHRKGLTIALRHTPGQPELPGAASDAAALSDSALIDDQATARHVLSALKKATWATSPVTRSSIPPPKPTADCACTTGCCDCPRSADCGCAKRNSHTCQPAPRRTTAPGTPTRCCIWAPPFTWPASGTS